MIDYPFCNNQSFNEYASIFRQLYNYSFSSIKYYVLQFQEYNMIAEQTTKTEEQIAKLKREARANRKRNQVNTFHLAITPEDYRGMRFFGNYRPKDRLPDGHLNDHRLAYLTHQYFLNRTVLDIGSGDAALTIEIAIRMFPERIVALDIDPYLLQLARKRVVKITGLSQKYKSMSQGSAVLKKLSEFPLYFRQEMSRNQNKYSLKLNNYLQIVPEGLHIKQEFPNNLLMLNDNFFNIDQGTHYDTILCMGTSKWVHLATGDTGITTFFQKIYQMLNVQGILVLQYPLWRSYHKKRTISDLYKTNLKESITIDPQTFPSLLKFVGLDLIQQIEPNEKHPLKHPLAVFRKSRRTSEPQND